MRTCQKNNEISKIPKPPHTKGREYEEYPSSFALRLFGNVVGEFNKEFPELAIPQELVNLRNAMAHGLIAEIDSSGFEELVKFKKIDNGNLKVDFSLKLESKTIDTIHVSLHQLRRHLALKAQD